MLILYGRFLVGTISVYFIGSGDLHSYREWANFLNCVESHKVVPGEKANDLIVPARQKRNGMSWSKFGSVALMTVSALVKNREYKRWFQTGTLSFSFNPAV